MVAVEGIDGAGKTTIATVIAQWCGERGIACVMSKEPTGLKWGNELRKSAREGRLTLEKELELFELDRRDHAERSIRPALAENNIVVLDRYYWSSAAYQGGRGADYNEIMKRNEEFAPIPDLVIVLNVDVDAGLQRIRMRGDKPNLFESKPALMRAKQIFLQLAEQRDNARVIDASGHLKDTAPQCLYAFQHAAIAKVTKAGPLHPEMVNLTLAFLGGDQIDGVYPAGSPPLSESLQQAKERV